MRAWRRGAVALVLAVAALVIGASTASAHPLGNFTVNHYDGLSLTPDRIDDFAVVDNAEIPTLQEKSSVDSDGDGSVSDAERVSFAAVQCRSVGAAVTLSVDGRPRTWTVSSSTFAYLPGAAGLRTSRLECRFSAAVSLHRPATVFVSDRFRADRVGWHEITAVGDGVQLVGSPVPPASVSNVLRRYPNDLLSSPLDQQSAQLHARPGNGVSTSTTVKLPSAGPLSHAMNALNSKVNSLVGSSRLGPGVGLLAVALSFLLGASHAALPGHGKTVMAAYIAGRRGSVRDAVTVGATVTITHTSGVIVLGLMLTAVTTLAGESVLNVLGVMSGLLIAGIGAGLLVSALRDRRGRVAAVEADHRQSVQRATSLVGSPPSGTLGHAHGHEHAHEHEHGSEHRHTHSEGSAHGHQHNHTHEGLASALHRPLSRRGLIGMGVAGGLVPSPSALIVLLAAIGLGRTWFGVLLVVFYGLGMAGTLTAAGLYLVHLRRRLETLGHGTPGSKFVRLSALTPMLTAGLVLVVGLGLAIRSAVAMK